MEIEYNKKKGEIILSNYKDDDLYVPSTKSFEGVNKYSHLSHLAHLSHLYKFIDSDCNVFIPINNGEDFIIKHMRGEFFNLLGIKDEKIIGKVSGEVFPFFKDAIYPLLREVYNYKKIRPINISFYQNHQLIHYFKGECFIENNEIYLLVKDIKDEYFIEKNFDKKDYSRFDNALNEMIIIKDGKIVRANNAFLKYHNVSRKELYNTQIDNFPANEVVSNSTGLNLTFSEIIEEILNEKYYKINFNFKAFFNNRAFSVQALAKKIIFENDIAVHIEFINPKEEFQYGNQLFDLKDNLKDKRLFTKIGIGFFNIKEKKFSWTDGIYDILEKKPQKGDSQKNILLELLYEEDFELINNHFIEIGDNKGQNDFFFKIKTPKGNVKYIHIYLEGIYKNSYLNRIVYFLMDITKQKSIEDDLELFNTSLNMVQTASKLGVCTITSKGYFWSKGIYDILEREERIDDSNHDIFKDLIIDEDKKLVDEKIKSYSPENSQINFDARIRTEKNNIKYLNCISKAIFDENEEIKSKTVLFQDITDKKMIEDQNIQLNEILRILGPKTKISAVVRNPEREYINDDEFFDIFGFEKSANINTTRFLENIMNSEDFVNKFRKFEKNKDEEFSEVFEYFAPISKDKKTLYLYLNHYCILEKEYLIGYVQDISESTKKEQTLRMVIDEKTILMKEIHHRVKNNLQILNSFLNLEEKFNKNNPEQIVRGVKSYIESLSLIHEKAYNSDNIGYVNVKDFLEDINSKLCSLFAEVNVEFVTSIQKDVFLLIDTLTPLCLIINELTINSIKHAFSNNKKPKKIYNSFNIDDDGICEFIYKDNGVGLPENMDIEDMGNLGWIIIKALSNQLDGTFSLIDGEGMGFKLKFPAEGKYIYEGDINGENGKNA